MNYSEFKDRIYNLYQTHGPFGFCKELIKKVFKKVLKKLLNSAKKLIPEAVTQKLKLIQYHKSLTELKQSLAQNRGKVIAAFPIIPWEFRWQRPQHLLSKFAQNGYTVIYLALSNQAKGHIYSSQNEAGLDISFIKLAEDVFQINLYSEKQFNIYTQKLHEGDLNNLFMGLASGFKHMGIKKPLYMVQFPGWSSLVYKMQRVFGGKIIFDCMDDHSGFSNNTSEALEEEHLLLKKSDLVITSSHLLEEKAKKENPNTILVKNGTEFEHFNKVYPNGQLDHFKAKPMIGYYGAISDWFDLDMVEYCARQRPDWNFVLIGSTLGCDISQVQQIPNLHFLGEKPYQELPGYLYYFDVCTIPFKIIPLTLATNPVKFYEYLSCGKPVVSVKLPELLHYQEYCYLAETQEEYLAMLEKALEEKTDQHLIQQRIDLAKENSWQSRYEVIKESVS